nr:hypothetical protein [uncultured Cohaesibacter sp.]
MTGLEGFKKLAKEFRSILMLGVGTTSIAPILVHFAGFSPIWPNGIGAITSVAALLVLIFAFQFSRNVKISVINRRMKTSLAVCLLFFLSYFFLFANFVFEIPVSGDKTYLGCGWSKASLEIVEAYFADPNDGCPGQFQAILEASSYRPNIVWTTSSINNIAFGILLCWVALFVGFANIVALFVLHQMKDGINAPN